jgi:hypothetical protein
MTMAKQGDGKFSWAGRFPDGRTVFYEGGDPDGFVKTIAAEFGFDPSRVPGDLTGRYDRLDDPREPTWDDEHGWAFHCPAEHLDAIYGSGRFLVGS